jgi:2-C-methyl-D-erythritol 4-phosphate cytidylyltransferase
MLSVVSTIPVILFFDRNETQVVRGEENNLKITYKSDLEIIEKAVI